MADVKVIWESGYSECEDCGSYDWYKMAVLLDGEEIHTVYGDNHLGGGYSNPEDYRDGYIEAARALGHYVELIIEDNYEN